MGRRKFPIVARGECEGLKLSRCVYNLRNRVCLLNSRTCATSSRGLEIARARARASALGRQNNSRTARGTRNISVSVPPRRATLRSPLSVANAVRFRVLFSQHGDRGQCQCEMRIGIGTLSAAEPRGENTRSNISHHSMMTVETLRSTTSMVTNGFLFQLETHTHTPSLSQKRERNKVNSKKKQSDERDILLNYIQTRDQFGFAYLYKNMFAFFDFLPDTVPHRASERAKGIYTSRATAVKIWMFRFRNLNRNPVAAVWPPRRVLLPFY